MPILDPILEYLELMFSQIFNFPIENTLGYVYVVLTYLFQLLALIGGFAG